MQQWLYQTLNMQLYCLYTFHSTKHTHMRTFILQGMKLQFHKTVLLVLSSQNNAQATQGVRGRK